jgi:hypothetical protein
MLQNCSLCSLSSSVTKYKWSTATIVVPFSTARCSPRKLFGLCVSGSDWYGQSSHSKVLKIACIVKGVSGTVLQMPVHTVTTNELNLTSDRGGKQVQNDVLWRGMRRPQNEGIVPQAKNHSILPRPSHDRHPIERGSGHWSVNASTCFMCAISIYRTCSVTHLAPKGLCRT